MVIGKEVNRKRSPLCGAVHPGRFSLALMMTAFLGGIGAEAAVADDSEWQVEVAPFVGQVGDRTKSDFGEREDLPSSKAPSDKKHVPTDRDQDGSRSAKFFADMRSKSRDIILDVDKDKIDEEDPESEEDLDSEDSDEAEEKSKTPKELSVDDLESDDPQYFLRQAVHNIKSHNYPEALKEINKCLLLDGRNWHAKYLGAYVYQLQGREGEAIERYRHFLEVHPDDVKANVNLATLLRKRGEFEEAEKLYRKAISANFYSLESHYNLANLLIETGRFEEALKELHTCLKFDRNNAWVHNNIGVLYQKRHYLEEAEEQFKRALLLEPANRIFERNLLHVKDKMRHNRATASDAADFL